MMAIKKSAGFTLIELMITVAIVAILAAVAYPAFTSQMQKSRRADAQSALMQAAALEEKWFFVNSQYTSTIANIGGATSPEGYYTIAVSDNNGVGNCTTAALNCFLLTATPVGAQAADAACTTLTLTHTGAKGHTGTGSLQDCW